MGRPSKFDASFKAKVAIEAYSGAYPYKIPEHCRTIKSKFFTKYLVTSEKSRTFAPQFALRILRNLLTV